MRLVSAIIITFVLIIEASGFGTSGFNLLSRKKTGKINSLSKSGLGYALDVLFGNEDLRNPRQGARLLLAIANKLEPKYESEILWRPKQFPHETKDPFHPNIPIYATNPDGTISVGDKYYGYYLTKKEDKRFAFGQEWIFQTDRIEPPYVYGADLAARNYYGEGSGAPSPDIELSAAQFTDPESATGMTSSLSESMADHGSYIEDSVRALKELGSGYDGNDLDYSQESFDASLRKIYGSYGFGMEDIRAVLEGDMGEDDWGSQTGTVSQFRGDNAAGEEEGEEEGKGEREPLGRESEREMRARKEEEASWKLQVEASDAAYVVGVLCATGIVPEVLPRNESMAIEWYHRAADSGSMEAVTALGMRYMLGEGVEENCRAASWYLKTVAESYLETSLQGQVVPSAHVLLRTLLRDPMALERLSLATSSVQVELEYTRAGMRHAQSLTNMGLRRLYGYGVPRNALLARQLLEEAAALGDHVAMFNLGYLFMHGTGAPKNETQALRLFERSAAAAPSGKYPPAINALGVVHLHGVGTPVNVSLARQFFQTAVDLNDTDAVFNLGSLILHTWASVPRDNGSTSGDQETEPGDTLEQAVGLFRRALSLKHWKAAWVLGNIAAEGPWSQGPSLGHCRDSARYFFRFVTDSAPQVTDELDTALSLHLAGDHWSALVRYALLAESGSTVAMEDGAYIVNRVKALGLGPQGTESGPRLAVTVLSRAAALNSSTALTDLAHMDHAAGNFQEASRKFTLAAELGEVEAMVTLAGMRLRSGAGEGDSHSVQSLVAMARKQCVRTECAVVEIAGFLFWAEGAWRRSPWAPLLGRVRVWVGRGLMGEGRGELWRRMAAWDTMAALFLTSLLLALIAVRRRRMAARNAWI